MKMLGSDRIVDLLPRYDIPYVPVNPEMSFRGLHGSHVTRSSGSPDKLSDTLRGARALVRHERVPVAVDVIVRHR